MILWQLRRGPDETASAVMFPLRNDATLLWWIKSDLEGARYFPTKTRALEAANQVRSALSALGWEDQRSRGRNARRRVRRGRRPAGRASGVSSFCNPASPRTRLGVR